MVSGVGVAVAASGEYVDQDGVRAPWGDMHGWQRGRNETLCGVSVKRAELRPFPHRLWADAIWTVESSGGHERTGRLCPGCLAAVRRKKPRQSPGRRENPRR